MTPADSLERLLWHNLYEKNVVKDENAIYKVQKEAETSSDNLHVSRSCMCSTFFYTYHIERIQRICHQ